MLLLRQERPLQPPLLKLTKEQKQEQRQQEHEEARRRKSKQHDERYAREWNGDPIELKHRWQEQEPATSAQSLANSPAGGRNLHASICALQKDTLPADDRCWREPLDGLRLLRVKGSTCKPFARLRSSWRSVRQCSSKSRRRRRSWFRRSRRDSRARMTTLAH